MPEYQEEIDLGNGCKLHIRYHTGTSDRIEKILYTKDGLAHQDNGKPAVLFYNISGKLVGEMYYIEGINKNMDDTKPCAVVYHIVNDSIVYCRYNDGTYIHNI